MEDLSSALDDPEADLNDYEHTLVQQIREHGWRSTHVSKGQDNAPSFTYSTGFWLTHRQPEIIVFDFPAQLAHDVLGTMFRKIGEGHRFATNEPVPGILTNELVVLSPVRGEAIAEYLISNEWFYKGNRFPCLQLFWADRSGVFPWQDGYDARLLNAQPDLSETD